MTDPPYFAQSLFEEVCCESGNPPFILAPIAVGVILWTALCLHETISRHQSSLLRSQLRLPYIFAFCLLVETLLFFVNTLLIDNVDVSSSFQAYWPPLEFMLLTASRLLLAACLLEALFNATRTYHRFLILASGGLILVCLASTLPWISQRQADPALQFVDTIGSVYLKAYAVILLGTVTLMLSMAKNRARIPALIGFALLCADSILILLSSDVMALDRSQASPVHGQLSNLAIIALGYACIKLRHISEKRLESGIQTSERLEALGQLSSGIAHDFNNHLQVILGYIELAGTQSNDPQALQKSLCRVQEAAEAAGVLVNQLLTFSRSQKTEFTVLDLNGVITSVSPMLSRLLGPNTMLTHTLDLTISPIRADKRMIEQVLFNLVINARDAMADGGTIIISTNALGGNHRSGSKPDRVRMTVSDFGCGMDKTSLRHAFEPFYTTKPVGEGTGLGLTTVHGIVKKHDAQVNIETTPGKGTHIHIDFSVPTEQLVAEPSPVFPATDGNGETILLTEDEIALRDLAQTFLTASGYQVLIANDGQHAIRIASTYEGRIDLCLFDVLMPRLNGYETYDRIRAMGRTVPALFVTGSTSRAESLRQQYPHLQKPFTNETLLIAVKNALKQKNSA